MNEVWIFVEVSLGSILGTTAEEFVKDGVTYSLQLKVSKRRLDEVTTWEKLDRNCLPRSVDSKSVSPV